jgi:hypothetical protein
MCDAEQCLKPCAGIIYAIEARSLSMKIKMMGSMHSLRAIMAVFLWMSASAGLAGEMGYFETGYTLKKLSQDEGAFGRGVFVGYVVGVADRLGAGKVNGYNACIQSENVSTGQLKDIVKRYLNDHPQSLQYIGSSLVAAALSESFPCN